MLESEAKFKEEAAHERLYLSIKVIDGMSIFRFGSTLWFACASKDRLDNLVTEEDECSHDA